MHLPKTTHAIMSRKHADLVAADMQKSDPQYAYTVESAGEQAFRVAVYDSLNVFQGYL